MKMDNNLYKALVPMKQFLATVKYYIIISRDNIFNSIFNQFKL